MARGGSDLIGNLAKKSPAYKLAVLLGVMVVLAFLYWQFLYSTLKDEQRQLQHSRDSLVKQVEDLKEREKTYNDHLKQKEVVDDQLKKNALVLPSSSELPAFFMQLQKQAGVAGVTLRNWKRLREIPVETFVKVPVAVEIAGSFYQINNYFKQLYGTGDSDRIITVESLRIGDPEVRNDEVILTARFTATTYRQKDVPPDTTLDEEAEGAGAGGGGKVGAATRARERQVEKASGEEDKSGGGGEEAAPAVPENAPKAGIDRLTNPGTVPE